MLKSCNQFWEVSICGKTECLWVCKVNCCLGQMPTSLFVLSVEKYLTWSSRTHWLSSLKGGKDISYMNLPENPDDQDVRASFFPSQAQALGCSGSFNYLEHESLPPTTLLPGQSSMVRKVLSPSSSIFFKSRGGTWRLSNYQVIQEVCGRTGNC